MDLFVNSNIFLIGKRYANGDATGKKKKAILPRKNFAKHELDTF
jgi:hypothetical protein